MKLQALKAKPQLIKLVLDDEEVVKTYGEAIEFWVYDRQPMDIFVRLASVKTDNVGELFELVNKMILDEQGNPILVEDEMLPTDVLTKVISKVVERLGK
jgi:hypothetical protein